MLQHTDGICQRLCEHYQELGIPSTFETNPGGHFLEPDLRMAKGITWLLGNAR